MDCKVTVDEDFVLVLSERAKKKLALSYKIGDTIKVNIPTPTERSLRQLNGYFGLANFIVMNVTEENAGLFLENLVKILQINSHLVITKDFIHAVLKLLYGIETVKVAEYEHDDFCKFMNWGFDIAGLLTSIDTDIIKQRLGFRT